MRQPLRRPRELARRLRHLARRRPDEVEAYLDTHAEEWEEIAAVDPHDAADILEALGELAAVDLIEELGEEHAADVLEEMQPRVAADVLEGLPTTAAALLLQAMPPDEAADVVAELEPEVRDRVLEALPHRVAERVRQLLAYPADSAGGLMTTEIAKLPVGMTTGEAIERIRQLHEELEDLTYVYIVDDHDHLIGVLSFRDIVFARPGVGLGEVMVRHPVYVYPQTDRAEVAALTQRYNLFGMPVVDHEHRLIGMVMTEAVLDAIQQEASEDFAAAVGAGAEETVYTRLPRSVRNRLPWLVLNLAMALAVTYVVDRQTGLIRSFPQLAAFMPVVALLGGNAGAQSLAVVIRALATDDLPTNRIVEVLRRQVSIGAVNGIAVGVMAGLVGYVFSSHLLGVAVLLATFANMTVATLTGSGIPLFFRAVGLDPALASNIFLTLISDLVGFGGFLVVAGLIL